MFYKIVKKFTKFTGKQVCWSLFSGFQPETFSKRGLWHKCLSLSFGKFFGTLFLTEHPWMTVPCVYLWILGSFSEHLFHKTPPGDCIFHAYVAGFQPANAIKLFHKYFSSILYKSKNQPFKGVHWISENYLWRSWFLVMMLDASQQNYENNSFTQPPSCIFPSFSQKTSWCGFGSVRAHFLSGKINESWCYLLFACSNTIHLSQLSWCRKWHLTLPWVRLLSNKQIRNPRFLLYIFVLRIK